MLQVLKPTPTKVLPKWFTRPNDPPQQVSTPTNPTPAQWDNPCTGSPSSAAPTSRPPTPRPPRATPIPRIILLFIRIIFGILFGIVFVNEINENVELEFEFVNVKCELENHCEYDCNNRHIVWHHIQHSQHVQQLNL